MSQNCLSNSPVGGTAPESPELSPKALWKIYKHEQFKPTVNKTYFVVFKLLRYRSTVFHYYKISVWLWRFYEIFLLFLCMLYSYSYVLYMFFGQCHLIKDLWKPHPVTDTHLLSGDSVGLFCWCFTSSQILLPVCRGLWPFARLLIFNTVVLKWR